MGKRPIAVLIPEFPSQTHAFFWREIAAIEAAGSPVQIFSTRRVPAEACPHDFRDEAVARTHYLFPPQLKSMRGCLASPVRTARAISYIMGLVETKLQSRLKLLALIPSAVTLVDVAHAKGIAHVHIHSCANAAHLGALARILGDITYSLTLHGDLPVYGTDHAAKFAKAGFVSAVTKPLSKAIESVSPQTHAPVIMMGVDTARFKPKDEKQPNADFTMLSVARLNPTKGHRFFLNAMAQLKEQGGPKIRYRIVGQGPAERDIRDVVETLSLDDQVEFVGSLSETEVLSELQSADGLVLPSIGQGEAAPVAVMEAMACGLPVVSSIIGGTADMIKDGVDGLLVAQQDVAGLADATKKLAEDPGYAAAMGAKARATALGIFDYKENAAKLLTEIKTVLKERNE